MKRALFKTIRYINREEFPLFVEMKQLEEKHGKKGENSARYFIP